MTMPLFFLLAIAFILGLWAPSIVQYFLYGKVKVITNTTDDVRKACRVLYDKAYNDAVFNSHYSYDVREAQFAIAFDEFQKALEAPKEE